MCDGAVRSFSARKGPWTYRDFVCFVKADAPDDDAITYFPLDNLESVEVA
jgi:hypothetical protein